MNRLQKIVGLLAVVGVLVGIARGFQGSSADMAASVESPKTSTRAPAPEASGPTRTWITFGIFRSITPPLRYDQLTPLIGPGTLVSESYLEGLHTQGYRWENSDGSYMALVIQNGVVVEKHQVGLQ